MAIYPDNNHQPVDALKKNNAIHHDLRGWLAPVFIFAFVIAWFVVFVFLKSINEESLSKHLTTHMKVLETTYRASIERAKLATKLVMDESILKNETILNIFARGISSDVEEERQRARDELYKILSPSYENFKNQGFKILHFHTKDAFSFLRFPLPNKFGDSLTDIRPSIVLTNKEKQQVSGFEMGRIKSGYRNVFPVFHNNQHIGSVELSFPFDEIKNSMSLLDHAKYYQLILRKESVYERLLEDWKDHYPESGISSDYLVDKVFTDSPTALQEPEYIMQLNKLLRSKAELVDKLKSGKGFTLAISQKNTDWSVTFYPVIDTLDSHVGYFIAYGKDSFITSHKDQFQNQLFAITLILLIVFTIAYLFFRSRLALQDEKLQLETVMDTIGDGLYVMDNQGIVTSINNTFTLLLGYQKEDIVGLSGHDVFHDRNHGREGTVENICPIFHTVSRGEAYFATDVFTHKLGHQINVEIDSRPIMRSGFSGSVTAFRNIDERIRAHKEIDSTKNLLNSIVDNIPITVFLKRASDLSFVLFNKAGEKLLGTKRSEMLGKTDYDFFPIEQADFFTNKDREVLASDNMVEIAEEPVRTAANEERLLHTKKIALRNKDGVAEYLLGISEDITEQHNQQLRLEQMVADRTKLLKASEQYQHSILNTVVDGIIVIDLHGLVRQFSPSATKIFGYSEDEIIGQNINMLMPEPFRSEHDGYLSRYSPDAKKTILRTQVELSAIRKNGNEFPLEISVNVTEVNGETLFVGVVRDITERKGAELAIVEAKEAAEQANIAKSVFLANMSHEIRTPMNGVIGMTDVLLNTGLSADQHRMAQVIHDSAHTQLGILNDILDFSKIEAGKLGLSYEPFVMADLIDKTCATLKAHAAEKSIALSCKVDESLPPALSGDSLRIRQILTNFASNAIKFSAGLERAGKVELTVELDQVKDGIYWVNLVVSDNGIGMDEATQDRLFHPFTQADSKTTRKYGGTGLGLVISIRLVEAMGGSIAVKSKPDVGSTFTARIPFEKADAPVSRAEVIAPSSAKFAGTEVPSRDQAIEQGRLVLVAEDNETNQEVIRQQLALLGYQCDVATDGLQAFNLWLTGEYGLLLSDIHMPNMDGYQLSEAIRVEEEKNYTQSSTKARLPILALTANVLKGEAERCHAAGMDGYLAKPVSLSELMGELVKWLPALDDEIANQSKLQNQQASQGDLPVFDINMLVKVVGENPSMHKRLLEKFLANSQGRHKELLTAIESGDMTSVSSIAHSLKSAARSIGAMQLGQLCESLEQFGKADDVVQVLSEFDLFESIHAASMEAIEQHLAGQ